jgi:hypothetical protein
MTISISAVEDAVNFAESIVDEALQALGQDDIASIVQRVTALAEKWIAVAQSQAPALAAEVATADAAADAAIVAKFGVGPGVTP